MEAREASGTKRGLHGWRAGLVVIGSGSAAALLVVAVIVGALRMAASSLSPEDPAGADAVAPSRGPVTSLEPGTFDLCDSMENMQAFASVAPERTDDGEAFVDTAVADPDERPRIIRNECAWDVQVGGMDPSSFDLSYESVASVADGESAAEQATQSFEAERNTMGAEFTSVTEDGDFGGLDEGSYFAYGDVKGAEAFDYVGLVKSTVFTIRLRSQSTASGQEPQLEAEYKSLTRELLPEVRERLDRVVPD
jgi:hypothetical protein